MYNCCNAVTIQWLFVISFVVHVYLYLQDYILRFA